MDMHETNVTQESFDSYCRTCMNESDNMRSLLYDSSETGRTLSEMLSYIAEIQVHEDDSLPKQICGQCFANAHVAFSFKELCQKTDMALKNIIKSDAMYQQRPNRDMKTSTIHFEVHESVFDDPIVKEEIQNDDLKINGNPFQFEFSCRLCFKLFKSSLELQDHMVFHEPPYKCADCDAVCPTEDAIQKHVFSEHNIVNPKLAATIIGNSKNAPIELKCENCEETFSLRKSLNNHKKKCSRPKALKRSARKIKREIVIESDNSMSNGPFESAVADEMEVHSEDFKSESMSSADREDSAQTDQDSQSQSGDVATACADCDLTFKSERACKIHAKRKHGPRKPAKKRQRADTKSLDCCSCSKRFDTLQELQDHTCDYKVELGLRPLEPFPCTLCERKFLKKASLDSHLRRHEQQASEVHSCTICKREFKRLAHLNNHMNTHTSDEGFKCVSCSSVFESQESLDSHILTHKGNKKHQCSFCHKGFNMLSTLKDHIRTHTGEKPFLCSICGRGFSQGTNLKEHLRRHQGYKPFACPQCTHTFVSKGELEAHLRKHSGAHPFVCDVCGSGFTTSSSLVKHKRIHTGERPYACDFCSMRFTALGTLKNHRRTHTGEKPYKCIYCVKAFVQKNDLVSHTRTHTGERPYTCVTCGHAFRQSSALKTHLKMHGGDSGFGRGDHAASADSASASPGEAATALRPGESREASADAAQALRRPDLTVTAVGSEPVLTVLPLCKTSPIGMA